MDFISPAGLSLGLTMKGREELERILTSLLFLSGVRRGGSRISVLQEHDFLLPLWRTSGEAVLAIIRLSSVVCYGWSV